MLRERRLDGLERPLTLIACAERQSPRSNRKRLIGRGGDRLLRDGKGIVWLAARKEGQHQLVLKLNAGLARGYGPERFGSLSGFATQAQAASRSERTLVGHGSRATCERQQTGCKRRVLES